MKDKLPNCHVCGKPKKPYMIFMKKDVFSIMKHVDTHDKAREGGEICERCNSYFYMTGILKEPTDSEFKKAQATT